MRIFVNPIALKTPISLVYSNRLADMFADNAKKHKNIVIRIITLNVLLRMLDIFSVEKPDY